MPAIEVKKKSKDIISNLIKVLKNNYTTYFIYNSFNNEVDTSDLILYLLDNKKEIFMPKIINDVFAIPFSKSTTFTTNHFGIKEPIADIKEIDNFVCIIPLLAVDINGNRVGFGKGYYDKFLKDKNCLKIGICYDYQIIDNVPKGTNDIPLDMVISEKRSIDLRKNHLSKSI